MEAAIKQEFPDTEIELIASGGGVFEVTNGGELIFSKKATGRFPEHEEVLAKLRS